MSPQEEHIINDEMPDAPQASGPLPAEGGMDASLFDMVPAMGETIPMGTYHFRLDGFTKGWNEPDVKKPEEAAFGKQPWYQLNWVCQQEPHTGRAVVEFCGWCNKDTFTAAATGNKVAQKLVKGRLFVIKDVLPAANYKPVGEFNIENFFATNPEIKLQLGLTPGKTDSGKIDQTTGKKLYIPDGSMRNKIIKHVSLTRPA